jgi:hypothetical protein
MATVITLVPGDPEQRVQITLDGVGYTLRARWNSRDDEDLGAWYLDAWDRNGTTPIAWGVKLVLGIRLGATAQHPLFSGGGMFLVDGRAPDDPNRGQNPRLNELGGAVTLWHFTAADAVLASLPKA